MTKYVNLTTHLINVHNKDGSVVDIPPSGDEARVSCEYVYEWEQSQQCGIDIFTPVYGEVTGVPDPREGTVYIVGNLVKARLQLRGDVMSPGRFVKDAQGKPCGCRGLTTFKVIG